MLTVKVWTPWHSVQSWWILTSNQYHILGFYIKYQFLISTFHFRFQFQIPNFKFQISNSNFNPNCKNFNYNFNPAPKESWEKRQETKGDLRDWGTSLGARYRSCPWYNLETPLTHPWHTLDTPLKHSWNTLEWILKHP